MKVIIYARYSSDRQTEQSIEGQIKVCREYAERNGYKVVDEYIDRAISGTSDNRPEFLRMIADSAKRQFAGVLVYQLDRFARNRYDSATYKARLKKNGVRVLSARENISDDASGILMEAVLEGMAEYYSVELSQKIKRGMELTAQKCEFTGSGVPLGYKIVDKKFAINKDEAPIVKRIFEMYLAGKTMADIIRYLNENGVKTSKGNPYNKNSIRRIITNRKYLGIYIYTDIEVPGGIPQIIDNTMFEQAQILMAKNKKAPARAKAIHDHYLLTTKLVCGECKCALTGFSGTSKTSKFYQYYGCVTQRRKGNCNKKAERKMYLENKVVGEIVSALTSDYIDNISQKIADLSVKEGNIGGVKRLRKLLKENETATANLIKAIESGKAVELFSSQIEKRQAERADLENQLMQEQAARPTLEFETVKYFFEKFRRGDVYAPVFRNFLIDTLVDRIEVYGGESPRLEIYCYAYDMPIKSPLARPERGSSKGQLVEAAGVEPASDNISICASPGADGCLHSLAMPPYRQATKLSRFINA